jgi:AAA domain
VLASSPTWIDRDGQERALTLADIIIITPYNAQVFEIQHSVFRVRMSARSTSFRASRPAIAIYSTATSSHADAPRGMEFLYSLNRFNVATSRAKCVWLMEGAARGAIKRTFMRTLPRWSASCCLRQREAAAMRWTIGPAARSASDVRPHGTR